MTRKLAMETKVLGKRRPRTDALPEDRAQLVHALGPRSGQRIVVEDGAVLGRDEACEVVVDDEGTSRRHARLCHEPGQGFVIEDLDSRNGTYVNGLPIKRSRLAFGDKIAIGAHTVFLFTRDNPLDDQVVQAQKLQMLGELAGGIVHDFNNILAAFSVGVDLLRDMSGGDARVGDCLRYLEDAAARGSDLTGQLLGFARGGSTQHDRIDLSQIATDAVRLLRRMVPRTVVIRADIAPGIGVLGSTSQMLQVIVNLAINGSDAMPDGGELEIRVVRSLEHAVVEVADTGAGMDDQTLAQALEPFFTTKPRGHGTGLGLATVDRVVREHHGSVALSSSAGAGTTVTVRLPFQAPLRSDAAAVESVPRLPEGTVVLMVEDDPVVRALTVQLLESSGAEVLVAEDGIEGIERFRDNASRLSVVMLDLDLPRMSGEEALEVMRGLGPEVPVLIASGYLDDERAHRLESAGVAGFMSKPFRRASMLPAIVAAIERSGRGRPRVRAIPTAGHGPTDTGETLRFVHGGQGMELDRQALAELLALEQTKPGLLTDVARLYLDNMPARLEAIAHADQPESRARAAHLLKGSSVSLGVTNVGKIAAAIEKAARAGEMTDHLLPLLHAAFDAIRPRIQALVDGERPDGE